MRAVVLAVAAALGCGAAVVACGDIFHDTSDFLTKCALDGSLSECPKDKDATTSDDAGDDGGGSGDAGDARSDGPLDLCKATPAEAQARAGYVCALLGACETPMGRNQFAPCFVQAIQAYDCTATPNRPVIGAALDYWKCLARATTCAQVHMCNGGAQCAAPTEFPTCSGGARKDCPDAGTTHPVHTESCSGWGQNCAIVNNAGQCLGATTVCTQGCAGTLLEDCTDAGDHSVDCASFGAGKCVSAGGLAACLATGDAGTGDAGCNRGADLHCAAGGVATGCPSGVSETVRCSALTAGTTKCYETSDAGPAWDVTRACFQNADCSGNIDTCDSSGYAMTSCYRGVTYSYRCSAPFNGCHVIHTTDGARAACAPPSP